MAEYIVVNRFLRASFLWKIHGEITMRFACVTSIVILSALCPHDRSIAAEFPYRVDATVYYQGDPPADGKYLRKNFLVTGTPTGFSPKTLNIYAELSTGPGTPLLQSVSCGVGEIQPGWTVTYRGVSCNWPDEIAIPPGKTLYASMSNAFGPFDQSSQPSVFPVITEAITAFPGKPPAQCSPPTKGSGHPLPGKSSVSVNVYQLPGAMRPDGTLDQTKICVVATPHGQDVAGLRLWGTLHARSGHKDTYVGSYVCIITNAPDIVSAEQTVVCAPQGNNNAPDVMAVPAGAKLYVATTITLGHVKSLPLKAVPVQSYGPSTPNPK